MRRSASIVVAFALLFTLACKGQGDIAVSLDFPQSCGDNVATHVQVYFLHGGTCDDCTCGRCLVDVCAADNCTRGCTDQACPIEQLDTGLSATPPTAGSYAIVYQLIHVADDGRMEQTALACVDQVQIDQDGTTDRSYSAVGTCCSDPL